MKIFYLALVLLSSLVIQAQEPTRVLFIGNSITYYNNMPQTFEDIANSKNDLTQIEVYAPGGTGILNHVNDANVYNLFRQGNWDYVVLQPGSNESPGYSETKEATLARIQKLQDSIVHYNPCAKTLIYEIPYGVFGNSASDIATYNNTMDLIRSNCEFWSDSAGIFFAPAGEVVRTAWNNDPSTMLWISTANVHPNEKGSYIIACSIYAGIFQKPSYGTNINSTLTAQEAIQYQQLADDIVLNHLPDWRINVYNQFTDFDFTTNQSTVNFTNLSQNIDSVLWDFGDGSTSTDFSPTHNYSQTGIFEVNLTTYKNSCTEIKTKSVEINSLGVNQLRNSTDCYPNPFNDQIIINSRQDNIEIYNISGQNMSQLININRLKDRISIDTGKLPEGLYIVRANNFVKVMYKL